MKSKKLEEDENGAGAGESESHGKEVNLSQGTKLIISIYFAILLGLRRSFSWMSTRSRVRSNCFWSGQESQKINTDHRKIAFLRGREHSARGRRREPRDRLLIV